MTTSKDFQKFGKPNIRDLCEHVATEIPDKWEEFGISVGVRRGDLRAIRAGRPGETNGFIQVFDKWHNRMTSPYTWVKVAEALESLHEKWLLEKLYMKLAKTAPSEDLTPKDFQGFGMPNLRDLCEYVGAKIPSKWRQFGIFVGVRQEDLDAIQASESQWLRNCFIQVFDKWHNGLTSPYTWEKVAEALESIGEKWLLEELHKKLKMTQAGVGAPPLDTTTEVQNPRRKLAGHDTPPVQSRIVTDDSSILPDVVTDTKPYLLSYNVVNTPDPASYWNLQHVHCTYQGEGTAIAIIDTGIKMNRQSFASRELNTNFFQFVGDSSLSNIDTNGHGTFCAGVACGDRVASNTPDGLTVECRGVAPKATLVVGKAIETKGSPWYIVQALQYLIQAIDQNNFKLDVVVLSSGGADQIPGLDKVIQALDQRSVIVVCAASNEGAIDKKAIWYPARYRETICIGSHDRYGKPSSFSPVGEDMDFLALGEHIIGPNLVDSLTQSSGTSFAAPAVGGLICLILEAVAATCHPDILKKIHSNTTMKKLLRKLTSEGPHNEQEGHGSIKRDQVKNFFSNPPHFIERLKMEKSI